MTEDDEAFEKLLGIMLTILIVGGCFYGISVVQRHADAQVAEMLETMPGVLGWWPEDSVFTALFFIPMMAAIILLPGAFGVRARQIMPKLALKPRMILLASIAVAMVASLAIDFYLTGHDIGVATAEGAVWLHDGEPRLTRTWAEASHVMTSCVTVKQRRSSEYDQDLHYDVAFPNERLARLSFGVGNSGEDIGDWIARVGPPDRTLREAGVTRTATTDEPCLTHYDEGMIPEDKATFRAILGD